MCCQRLRKGRKGVLGSIRVKTVSIGQVGSLNLHKEYDKKFKDLSKIKCGTT